MSVANDPGNPVLRRQVIIIPQICTVTIPVTIVIVMEQEANGACSDRCWKTVQTSGKSGRKNDKHGA